MTIAEMRVLLGMGSEYTDAEVVAAYAVYVGAGPPALVQVAPVALDPFAMALHAIFHGPGSAEAIYTPKGGTALSDPIRVIRGQPDRTVARGEGQIVEGTNLFEIRRSDVAQPVKGDLVEIPAGVFKLLGEAMLDVEGLTWTIGAAEAA